MSAYYDKITKNWYCIFYFTDWKGTKKQKKKRGFSRKKDALEYEREFLDKLSSSPDIAFSGMVELYLADKKMHTKLKTYKTKKSRILTWILPYFNDKAINAITAADIRQWQGELKEAVGATGEVLSSAYMQNLVTELSGIFNFAVRFYNLPANPCRVAGNLVGKKGKSLDFWTREEFDRFVDTFDKTDPYYAAFMTLYYTGMRIGELQALTIADVDLKEGVIHISKTYSVIDGKEVITAPKTEKSNRDVLIPHFLCEILKEQVQRYYKVPPNTRLFQMSRQPYREQMKKHCRLAGVKKIRLHDLRHSHASLLIELGFSALLVSERLGHESVSTTLDIYAHLFPSKQVQVVERLNKLYDGLCSGNILVIKKCANRIMGVNYTR